MGRGGGMELRSNQSTGADPGKILRGGYIIRPQAKYPVQW